MKEIEVNSYNIPAAARSKNYKSSLTSAVGVNSTTAPTAATPTGSADTAKVAQNLAADSTDWMKIMRKDIDERTENSLSIGKNLGVDGKATISELVCTALSAASATIQTLTATALTATGATILGALTAATVSATTMSATTFNGELNGNAATATRLKTARNIFGQSYDGSSDIVGASYHTFNGSAVYFGDSNQHRIGCNTAGSVFILGSNSLFLATGGSSRLFISSSGYVGIGSSSPNYLLDVNGNMRVVSDLYADATVGTRNYTSHLVGWNVNVNGVADFRNVYADEMRVQAFTADISQALAGSDYLTKSVSKLSANFVVPSVGGSVRIIVDDIEGMPATQCFNNGDYIRFRAFNRTSGLTIANVWGTVTLDTSYGTNGFNNGTQAYTFSCTATSGAGLTVFKGSEVLDYGTSGSGMISRTTLDAQGSPYEQIATWVNDPSNSANYTVHARLGNLGGIQNCNGYGVYTDNGYFTGNIVVGDLTKTNNYLSFDGVNGLQIKLGGSNVATTADVSTAQANAVSQAATNAANLYVASTIYNAYVSATDQALGTKVSQTDFNSLGVTVGQHSTAIQQNAQAITTKVSSTDYTGANIASLINQSASTVAISAAHIDLVGAVTATALTAGCVTSDKVNMTEFTASTGFVDAFNANIVTTGRLDAATIVANGIATRTIDAQNATITNLSVNNGTIYNLRGPWTTAPTDLTTAHSDNVVMPGAGAGSYFLYALGWTAEHIGRKITLAGPEGIENSRRYGGGYIQAPAGKYFYINGNRMPELHVENEIIELIGYGRNGTFYGWVVTNIIPLADTTNYGRVQRILAQGRVEGSATSASITASNIFNHGYVGTAQYSLSASRISQGVYRVGFPTQWGLGVNYMVMLTGYGHAVEDVSPQYSPIKATLKTISDGYFEVATSDDATVNDGSFEFQLIALSEVNY